MGGKLLYINNLRTVLIVLIVMLHIAITYGAAGSWYYNEDTDSVLTAVLLTVFNAVVQSFALGFFYMIAGYFTPASYGRRGPKEYLKCRFVRLGVPLAVFYFAVNPLIIYGLYGRPSGMPLAADFGTGPLWFVQVLLMFSIGFHLWRAYVADQPRGPKPLPRDRQIVLFILVLSAVNFLVRVVWPAGRMFSNLQFGYFPGYIFFYAVGVAAYHSGWFEGFDEKVGMRWLKVSVLAIPLFPIMAVLGGALEDVGPFQGGLHWQSLFYSSWEAVTGTGLIAGLLVIFRRRFDSQSSLARSLSDNAYGVYIVHAPVIVFWSYTLRGLLIHPLAKFALVAVTGVGLCFLASHFVLRRIPYSDRVL